MAEGGSRGVNVKDVASADFVVAYAAHLKRIGKIEVPKWADLVKTAAYKELAPYDPDWYYIRAAAIARRVYIRGGTGVGAFKKIFGGRKSRGTRHEIFAKGSGSVARHILKQLEVLKIIEKVPSGKGCAAAALHADAHCQGFSRSTAPFFCFRHAVWRK
eukprot:4386953-Pleurochrysis_carterae.AAC.1